MQRLVSSQGKTVVCIIHQPSSELLSIFHQLILVADGRIAYSGPPNQAISFFERYSYIYKIMSKKNIHCQLYSQTIN